MDCDSHIQGSAVTRKHWPLLNRVRSGDFAYLCVCRCVGVYTCCCITQNNLLLFHTAAPSNSTSFCFRPLHVLLWCQIQQTDLWACGRHPPDLGGISLALTHEWVGQTAGTTTHIHTDAVFLRGWGMGSPFRRNFLKLRSPPWLWCIACTICNNLRFSTWDTVICLSPFSYQYPTSYRSDLLSLTPSHHYPSTLSCLLLCIHSSWLCIPAHYMKPRTWTLHRHVVGFWT